MKLGPCAAGALLLATVIVGCRESASAPPAQTPAPPASQYPTRAQPRLPTRKLYLGAEELVAELALTGEQEMTGMMFRTNILENEAMLFVFRGPSQQAFWMKNTIVPLSIGFIDPDGTLLEVSDLQPLNTNAVSSESLNIQYVLETKQGWFERHHIRPGALIKTDAGSLRQTFFGQK